MRKPNEKEAEILKILAEKAKVTLDIDSIEIESMSDGGMGSFSIGKNHENRAFGSIASEYEFKDSDNKEVLASLFLDQNGELFEVDIFKSDHSPTKVLNENT